jgi:hypothetical protein
MWNVEIKLPPKAKKLARTRDSLIPNIKMKVFVSKP